MMKPYVAYVDTDSNVESGTIPGLCRVYVTNELIERILRLQEAVVKSDALSILTYDPGCTKYTDYMEGERGQQIMGDEIYLSAPTMHVNLSQVWFQGYLGWWPPSSRVVWTTERMSTVQLIEAAEKHYANA